MMPPEAKAAKVQQLLPSKNAANTATATGAWIDIRTMVGAPVVIQNVGAVTGSITGAIETAEDDNGTNNEALILDGASNNFTLANAANNIQVRSFDINKSKGYVRYVGTIVTGPVVVGASIITRPKETT